MQRTISISSLLFSSVSAILGSGWLFSAYYTSSLAGPASMLSWVIGGIAMIIVAFVFAEISATIPVMGSSSRIPHYTHGTIVGFLFSWMIWLSYAVLVSSEVQAIIQYSSYFFPSLVLEQHHLSLLGIAAAVGLTLLLSIINIYSLRWLLRFNNTLTILKIAIPLVVSAAILMVLYTPGNIINAAHSPFMPLGWHGVLAAITTGGIIFAFNGFKQACELAGETKNPMVSLPIAIIGSVTICLLIYMILQAAFLTSMTTSNISHSWSNLSVGQGDNSPFAAIITQDKLGFLIPLLYLGAFVAPFAAALMYVGSSGRSLYAISANGYLPLSLQKLTTQGNPIYAIMINFLVSLMLFAPLPGWSEMITFLSSLVAITYAVGPICLLALREQLPLQERRFKLPFAKLWSLFAFYICTLMAYWTGWVIIEKLCIALILGVAVLFCYSNFTKRGKELVLHWNTSIWVWPYFSGLILISYLGNFGGGLNVIPFGWDFAVIAVLSLFTMKLAIRYKLPAHATQKFMKDIGIAYNH